MAKQTINIGTVANDGTGDTVRDSFDKSNDNFTELYDWPGYGYYQDAETTPATLTINTTPSQLQIDGAGANSVTTRLPLAIRGSSELWASDALTPIAAGDSYNLRLDLEITAKTGSPTILDLALDIGATPDGTGGAGSILVVQRVIGLSKTPPYNISLGFPIFCESTFLANGGSIWLSTDAGTITLGGRGITIVRTGADLG